MKAAIIPPIPHLGQFGTGDIHLLLAHLMDNTLYHLHYKTQRNLGKYLILDNSAHEFKEGCEADELAAFARLLGVQEVIVPDVLDNGPRTVDRAVDALEMWFERGSNLMGTLNPTLMYVPQGVNREEYYGCMKELIDLHLLVAKKEHVRDEFVLGISKDYEDFPGGLYEILVEVERMRSDLRDKGHKMQVHILGWHRNLWVLGDLARSFPWIRSTDSCKPFQYAMAGITLDPSKEPPVYPGRHAVEFFETILDRRHLTIAGKNCAVFRIQAEGRSE